MTLQSKKFQISLIWYGILLTGVLTAFVSKPFLKSFYGKKK